MIKIDKKLDFWWILYFFMIHFTEGIMELKYKFSKSWDVYVF